MIFRREHSSNEQKNQTMSEATVKPTDSAAYVLQEDNDEVASNIRQRRKKEIGRLLIAFGILLIAGVFLMILVPHVKNLARHYYLYSFLNIVNLLLPFFWALLGWTLMQTLGVLGMVKVNQIRQSRAIYIIVLTLMLLYTVILLPFLIESIRCMVLEFQYAQNPAAYPNGFSYSYHLPTFLLRTISILFSMSHKSAVFSILGVTLWLSGQSAKRRYKT